MAVLVLKMLRYGAVKVREEVKNIKDVAPCQRLPNPDSAVSDLLKEEIRTPGHLCPHLNLFVKDTFKNVPPIFFITLKLILHAY